MALSRALLTYWFRPGETLASLLDRPSRTFERWDGLAVTRPVVAVAGLDAHARIPLAGQTDVNEGRSIGLPSYESSFRALSQSVVLAAPLGRTAASASRDASAVLSAVREGNVYTVVDGLAGPARLDFHALVDGARIEMGKSIAGGRPVQLIATVSPPVRGSSIVLIRNGEERGPHRRRRTARHDAATGRDPGGLPSRSPPPRTRRARRQSRGLWATRYSSGSLRPRRLNAKRFVRDVAAFDGTLGHLDHRACTELRGPVELATGRAIEQRALHFTWRLAAGPPSGQYAALVVPIHGDALLCLRPDHRDGFRAATHACLGTNQNPAGRGIAMAAIDLRRRDAPHPHSAAQRHEAD